MKKILLPLLLLITVRVFGQTFTPSVDFSNKVINSFSQGFDQVNGRGVDLNCASIAIVKCAIGTFGLAAAVKVDTAADHQSFTVTLRNQQTLSLTAQEVGEARTKSGFALLPGGDTVIYNKAILLYAVLAKRAPGFATAKLFTTCKDFDSSLAYLRAGINADNLPPLLGLALKKVPQNSQVSWVYGNAFHAVFASLDIFDDDGTRKKINLINWAHHVSLRPARVVGDFRITRFSLIDQH
jgi:hypothetical protein